MATLEGMTQAKWDSLTQREREQMRDLSDLSPQLIGLEGWRVEATDHDGEIRRFIVAKSIGWRPIHLEISRRSAGGGLGASRSYASVRKLYRVR